MLQFAPVLLLHPNEQYLPSSIEYILQGAQVIDDAGRSWAQSPSQSDLWRLRDPRFHLDIHPSQYGGESLGADGRVKSPIYVAAQVAPDRSYVDLNFILLFPYNGAQAVRILVPYRDFNCALTHLGEHQGDIESVTVRVSPDFRRVIGVRFEAHGDSTFKTADDVNFYQNTHPVARVAFNAHGTFSDRGLDDNDWHRAESYAAIGFGVDFIDIITTGGPRWQPFEIDARGRAVSNNQLIFVGLDSNNVPRNEQLWAGFAGRIGNSQQNKYVNADGIGSSLTFMQRTYTNSIVHAVLKSGAIKADRFQGDGPVGLASRDIAR